MLRVRKQESRQDKKALLKFQQGFFYAYLVLLMVKQQRIAELDALRGFAALSVCFFHCALICPGGTQLLRYLKYGGTGVDLFFMISGFVIFMSLNSSQKLKDFWFLRFVRLFPVYWIAIVITIALLYFGHAECSMSWNYIIGNIFMIYPVVKANPWLDPCWTLYVELTFYFFIGLIAFCKWLDKIELLIWIGLLTVTVINGVYILTGNCYAAYIRFFIITREVIPLISYFGFFAGGILYYRVYTLGWSANRVILLILCFLFTLLIHSVSGRLNLLFSAPERLLCEVFFNILFIAVIKNKAGFLKMKWLLFAGTISYALYLIHASVGQDLSIYLYPYINKFAALLIGLTAAIILSALITFFLEKPVQRWVKRKYFAKYKSYWPFNRAQ
jgi:peptidoglycan/LPS O-acetylase OafA/YrhL